MSEYLWLPHPSLVWVPARLEEDDGGLATYQTVYGESITLSTEHMPISSLEKVSDNSMRVPGMSNLVNLDEFGEGAVAHQLRERYKINLIYTNIGSILVSVNPYQLLPIYAASYIDRYKSAASAGATALAAEEPHIYSIAAEAYSKLYDDDDSPSVLRNQAVIISGESGAGKTEATKTVLQYLSEVAGSVSGAEQQILQSNPVLEAFGNAKTLRNNNSSRFGKWMEIHFEPVTHGVTGRKIIAAKIINYLLEQNRVTVQTPGERSYHVLYQLCAGLSSSLKEQFGLNAASEYHYLNQSGCYTIGGVDDVEDFDSTQKAMRDLNFEESRIESIWRLLAAVLQIGNLEPKPNPSKTDLTIIANEDALKRATATLGLPSHDVLSSALCYRSVTIRGSLSMIPLSVAEVADNRDALAKTIYAKLFDFIIAQMNDVLFAHGDQTPTAQKTDLQRRSGRSIGILDIFGFEIFDNNLFSQLLINYANEKLQGHFNTHIFSKEQAEYRLEGIDVAHIAFVDNIECLNLLEHRRGLGSGAAQQGIFSMLDEELLIPRGSDASLISKMHSAFATKGKEHAHYGIVKKSPETFIIRHYAGEVTYNSDGLLATNKNKLNDNLELLMAGGSSSLKILAEIFNPAVSGDAADAAAAPSAPSPMARRGGIGGAASSSNSPSNASKKKESTLSFKFNAQLHDLMSTLHACSPHYIRTLKPNSHKAAGDFDTRMVLTQMKYSGLFEAIRIRKSGFPFRKPHGEFGKRYRVCLDKQQIVEFARRTAANEQSGVEFLLAALTPRHLTAAEYQIGKTKVFLKTSQRHILDALRDANLTKWAVQIQAVWRMVRARRLKAALRACHQECVAALAADCTEESLSALISRAHAARLHHYLFILVRVGTTLTAIREATRVADLLSNAVASRELEAIEGGLEQATRLQRDHATVVTSDYTSAIKLVRALGERVAEAKKLRDHLLEELRLLQALRDATLEESLVALRSSMAAAVAFGIDAQLPAMTQAATLLAHLEAEEALMESLRAATRARDVTVLERLISEVQTKGVSLEGSRTADLSSACTTLKAAYLEKVRALMTPHGEAQLKSAYLSKMSSLAYTDIVTMIETYLRDAEAERVEAARVREEARRAEEARLAQERAHLDAAEKARLEEEDRVRRAAEDAAREAEEAAMQDQDDDFDLPPPPMPPMPPPPPSFPDDFHPPLPPLPPPPPPPASSQDDGLPPPPPDDLPPPPDGLPPPPPEDDSLPPPPGPPEVVFIPPPAEFEAPKLPEHPIDLELDAAILKRSLPALERAIATATSRRHTSRLVRVAQNMASNLRSELKIRSDLMNAIGRVDVEACKQLIKAATTIGFLKDPLIEEARTISYGLSPADLLSLRLQKALPNGNADELRRLLQEAADLKPTPLTNNEWVEQVKDWFASHLTRGAAAGGDIEAFRDLDWNTTMRLNRTKVVQQLVYANFANSKGQFPLNEVNFTPLRRAGNYAKGNYLSKGELKEKRLTHQVDAMPRSLVKLSTEYCGGKEKSKSIKLQAKQVFTNVRGYMRDKYHSYPATLAYDILTSGVSQPLLRDEIYCQLIKQTTGNPSTDSLLYGLKMFYLCLSTFPPSSELKLCLWSHLSQFAHPSLPDGTALGFQLAPDIASACFIAMEHVAALTTAGIPIKPPAMADIESMTAGSLAKRSGRFEDAIKAAAAAANVTRTRMMEDQDLPAPPQDEDLPAPPQ